MLRILAIFLCIALAAAPLTGCAGRAGASPAGDGNVIENAIDKKDGEDKDMWKKPGADKYGNISSDINKELTGANNKFAVNIFKELSSEDADSNLFISPLSMSSVLTMAYIGAGSTTRQEMGEALGFGDLEESKINSGFKVLLKYLESADKKVELNISNSIWIREGTKIKKDFLAKNEKYFNAKASLLDFSDSAAADIINKWISDATKGKIDKMIEPPIHPQTVMYLINAIYFKGQWAAKFNERNTSDETFTAFDGTKQKVRMMNRKGKIDYAEGADYTAVRLPYGEGKISMYVVLPDEGVGIDGFIAGMTSDKWNEIRGGMSPIIDLTLKMPKFKIEYGIKDICDSLKALGMVEAFTGLADFSGMGDNLYIDKVLHKAVVEVNEEGSEAAAATVGEMRVTSISEPLVFVADRPFMFAIADDATGSILFMGKFIKAE